MSIKTLIGIGMCCGMMGSVLVGCGNDGNSDSVDNASQLVFLNDTQSRVDEMLGDPEIEFPVENKLVRWYAGYEVTLSNRVVVALKLKPVASEE